MAVPAGRSVVFVTGNAKKLEEVRGKHFKHLKNVVPTLLLFGINIAILDNHLTAFIYD